MDNFDITVIGGGFSGVAAAIAAAREGLNVLLIEESNCLGGAASVNLVNPFMPSFIFDDNNRVKMLSRGIFESISKELSMLTKKLDGEDSHYSNLPLSVFNENT